jgi:hypothetical protein
MTWNSRGPTARATTVFARSLNAPERRPKQPPAPNTVDPEPLDEDIDAEPGYLDELDEIEAMPFEEFYATQRGLIDQVRAGSLPSIADAEAAADARRPKDRPWASISSNSSK